MKKYNRNKQRGTTMLLAMVFMFGLFAAVGLATDTGHLLVNKTRLQNAMDASALSAAIALHADINKSTAVATTSGKNTFDQFIAAGGNHELSDITSGDLLFEYSQKLNPFTVGAASPNFVRVSTSAHDVDPILIQMLPAFKDPINVAAEAVAGAVGQNCSLKPFVLCADMTPLDTDCSKPDNDDPATCYGYTVGTTRNLVFPCHGGGNNEDSGNGNSGNGNSGNGNSGNGNNDCAEDTSLESGNFSLLNLGDLTGGRAIRDAIDETHPLCNVGDTLETKPGYTWGNVSKGIDDLFDSDADTQLYPDPAHTTYIANKIGTGERELAVPIGDCRGIQNGNTTIPKVGVACVFLTQKTIGGPEKEVMIEFSGNSCEQNGQWDPKKAELNGIYKIVLFKSAGSDDS